MAQQFLDRCCKRRYISKKLEIGELLKVQDHRICRKVSSIPNHPLRANFLETKITRYNLRNNAPINTNPVGGGGGSAGRGRGFDA